MVGGIISLPWAVCDGLCLWAFGGVVAGLISREGAVYWGFGCFQFGGGDRRGYDPDFCAVAGGKRGIMVGGWVSDGGGMCQFGRIFDHANGESRWHGLSGRWQS